MRENKNWLPPKNVKIRKWNYIVLHHSATHEGSVNSFDRFHREEKGWDGIGYHFVIGNGRGAADGEISPTYRWNQQLAGAHARNKDYNEHGIGICLVGNFNKSHLTSNQITAMRKLVKTLSRRYNIDAKNILRHKEVAKTACPGKNFPWPIEF